MYYKISDYCIPVIIGGLASLCVFKGISPGWNMFLAMAAGMGLGMLLQIFVFLVFMPLFGAFEVMMPAMISGMASGMISGMLASHYTYPLILALILGGGLGILVGIWIETKNRKLQGEAR